jgi:hypothetical protein
VSRKERFRSMGYQGGTSRRAAQTRRYPLRRVVNEFASKEVTVGDTSYEVEAVELECGHKVSPPTDIIGRRYPARMRCRRCWEAEQGSSK